MREYNNLPPGCSAKDFDDPPIPPCCDECEKEDCCNEDECLVLKKFLEMAAEEEKKMEEAMYEDYLESKKLN
jgi:hypothetical protein